MGGDDANHQHQVLRRPRPRPQRTGEKPLVHRRVAPLPISESSPSNYHRVGGGSSGEGGGSGIVRGRNDTGRARRSSDNHRGGRESAGHGAHTEKDAVVLTTPADGSRRASAAQPSPSPPRKKFDLRPSNSRSSIGAVTAVPSGESPYSRVRQLRTARIRSPMPASDVMSDTRGGEVRPGVTGKMSVPSAKTKTGQNEASQVESVDTAAPVRKGRRTEERTGAGGTPWASKKRKYFGAEFRRRSFRSACVDIDIETEADPFRPPLSPRT